MYDEHGGDTTHHAERTFASELKDSIFARVSEEELELLSILEANRPEPLRAFDQIPMQGADLLFQVKMVAPQLAGKDVVFVGDYDSSSLLLGLLSSRGFVEAPSRMTLVDFDERLLESARKLAKAYNFGHLFEARLYNVFDPVPKDLERRFDAFYTNPPYGASNMGESTRLFINRGCDFVKDEQATGYVIMPSDKERFWTREAMYHTQHFLVSHGWRVDTLINEMHGYHLDDDQSLMSSLLIAEKEAAYSRFAQVMPYTGRTVDQREIKHFYGKLVLPNYPHYINEDGQEILRIDTLH